MSVNRARSAQAQSALRHFENTAITGPPQETVTDLITNIGHYCEEAGFDFLAVLQTSVGHWCLERADPFSAAEPPTVTISINERISDA